jgi:hypothetical protein
MDRLVKLYPTRLKLGNESKLLAISPPTADELSWAMERLPAILHNEQLILYLQKLWWIGCAMRPRLLH